MEVCFAVHKTINLTICNTVFFFTSGGGFDEVLVRLQLIEKCIKGANLMCILFSIKHPQTIVNKVCPICPELLPTCILIHLAHNS